MKTRIIQIIAIAILILIPLIYAKTIIDDQAEVSEEITNSNLDSSVSNSLPEESPKWVPELSSPLSIVFLLAFAKLLFIVRRQKME